MLKIKINTVINNINGLSYIEFYGNNIYECYLNAVKTMYSGNFNKIFVNNKFVTYIPLYRYDYSKIIHKRFIKRTENNIKTEDIVYNFCKTTDQLIQYSSNKDLIAMICNKIYFSSSLDPIGARKIIKNLNLKSNIPKCFSFFSQLTKKELILALVKFGRK